MQVFLRKLSGPDQGGMSSMLIMRGSKLLRKGIPVIRHSSNCFKSIVMGKIVITASREKFIIDHYESLSDTQIAKHLGVSKATVCSYRKRKGLYVSREEILRRRSAGMTGKTTSTPEMDKIIKRDYLKIPSKTLAAALGKSDCFLRKRMEQLGLVIPEEIIQKRKENSRIKKGAIPPNKGKKQSEYMTPEQIEKTKATRFKKGQMIHNEAKDGNIRIRHSHKSRNLPPYKWIRISKGKWEMLHVHNWEKEHGPVPKGNIIVFRTRDTMNCELDNLEMITRAEHAIRNSNHENPSDSRIAFYLATRSRKTDKEMRDEIMKHPELIEAKRQSLKLKRLIKNERSNNSKTGTSHK